MRERRSGTDMTSAGARVRMTQNVEAFTSGCQCGQVSHLVCGPANAFAPEFAASPREIAPNLRRLCSPVRPAGLPRVCLSFSGARRLRVLGGRTTRVTNVAGGRVRQGQEGVPRANRRGDPFVRDPSGQS